MYFTNRPLLGGRIVNGYSTWGLRRLAECAQLESQNVPQFFPKRYWLGWVFFIIGWRGGWGDFRPVSGSLPRQADADLERHVCAVRRVNVMVFAHLVRLHHSL